MSLAIVRSIVLAPFVASLAGALPPHALRSTAPGAMDVQSFPELNLTFDLSMFESLAPAKTSTLPSCKGEWTGKLGASGVHVFLNVDDVTSSGFLEPEDVVMWRRGQMLENASTNEVKYSFEPLRSVPGPFGAAPFLATTRAVAQSTSTPAEKTSYSMIAGLLDGKAWTLLVEVKPPPEPDRAAALRTALDKCAKYDGKARDPKWTDSEAQSLWKQMAPESTQKTYAKPIRSDHFIILSDFPSASQFAKPLEAHYAAAKKVLAFEDQKGRRLLPVLVFRTQDEFQLFFTNRKKLDPKTTGSDTGVAFGPLYATSFDNDDEEDQRVDVATQLMINRAHCWSGGSWFSNGMRYYIGWKPASFAETRGLIKKNRATPLDKLLDDSRWGEKAPKKEKTPTEEPDFWDQSALWMEFLCTGPAVKAKFPELVQRMSTIPDGEGEMVKAALESIYGMQLPTLQSKWVEYIAKK